MKLDIIKNEIQRVEEAISLVLNIDVTIVNDDMKRIAGTGIYKDKIGDVINGYSAFKKSFDDKKSLIIDPLKESIFCKDCYRLDDCKEEAEVCCPIIFDDVCYGVIGLIAFNSSQKDKIMYNKTELLLFLEKNGRYDIGKYKS